MKRYYRQRHYGKPLPAKRDIKAHLQFLALVAEAGEQNEKLDNNIIDKKRTKVSYDVIGGRIQRQK